MTAKFRSRHLPTAAAGVLASAALALTACASPAQNGSPKVSAVPSGTPATGSPVQIGYLNTESGTLANPDFTAGVDAAVAYVNSHEGVNGHPIKLVKCSTDSTPAGSAACGAKLARGGLVAILAGSDQAADASLPPIEQAQIPYFASQPTTAKTYTSPVAFAFNGGAATAYPAHAQFISATLKAKKVSIIYADLPTGLEVAKDLAQKALTNAGVASTLVPAPYTGGDLSAQVAIAKRGNPDVIWTIQTSASCSSVMRAAATLGVTQPMVFNGACLSDKVIKGGGAGAKGAYFDSNFPIWQETTNPEVALYRAAMAANTANPVYNLGSELGFAQVMNMTAALKGSTGDMPTAAGLAEFLNKGTTVRGFLSHDFTCDKKQVPERPALCNPYVKIVQWDGSSYKTVTSDWLNGAPLLK